MKGVKRGGLRTFAVMDKVLAYDHCYRDDSEGPAATIMAQVQQIKRENEQTARRELEERMEAEAKAAVEKRAAEEAERDAAKAEQASAGATAGSENTEAGRNLEEVRYSGIHCFFFSTDLKYKNLICKHSYPCIPFHVCAPVLLSSS